MLCIVNLNLGLVVKSEFFNIEIWGDFHLFLAFFISVAPFSW